MRAALGIAVLAAGLGLVGVAAKIGQPERAVSGPSIRARPSGAPSQSPPPNRVADIAAIALANHALRERRRRKSDAPPEASSRIVVTTGVVVDDRGVPVAGAEVRGPYRRIDCHDSLYKCQWLAKTDAD